MKILILGGSGMLGHKLVQRLSAKFEVWTTLRDNLSNYQHFNLYNAARTFDKINVENIESVEDVVSTVNPQVVINAVGVIKQLDTSKNVIKTLTINSIFPHKLAEITRRTKARLITISTDCVFLGDRGSYSETDVPDALDLYGQSKHFGEVVGENCLTLRTSIIGRELKTEHSLVEWFLSNQGGTVKGFSNAIYSGFPTVVLADVIGDLISEHKTLNGLYHISSDPIDKLKLLQLIKQAYRANIEIEPFADFIIDRSLNSSKFRKIVDFYPPAWEDMIKMMADDPTDYDKFQFSAAKL